MLRFKIFGFIALAAALCACSSSKAEVAAVATETPQAVNPVDEALAKIYNQDYNDAIEYATQIMNTSGESVEMLTIRGVAYAKMDKTFKAFSDLNAAVKMEYSAYTLNNLGNALRMFGHCARAANAFEAALALEPGNQALQINLVSAYACYGDTASASEVFLKVINNFPQDSVAFTTAAILKATVGDMEESIKAAQKAISFDSYYKPAYKILSHACKESGNAACAKQAEDEFNKLNGQAFRNKKVTRKPRR